MTRSSSTHILLSNRAFRFMLPLVAALFVVTGCDSSTDPDPGDDDDTTQFSIYLTDAPGEVADVWVEIADVHLVGQGQPQSILDSPTELISLLDLQGTSMLIVEDSEIEPGTYSQLRFVIDAAVLETVDGEVYTLGGAEHPGGLEATGELHCPSCGQSGLKVNFAGGLEIDEGSSAALVDFDVAQSFGRQAGQSGRWVMRPVIQGVVTDPDNIDVESGFVSGQVVLDEDVTVPVCGGEQRGVEHFIPLATSTTLLDDEDDPFTFAGSTDSEGDFEITVLHTDIYSLDYHGEVVLDGAELQWQADVSPASVNVGTGQTASGVVFTVTSATCVADSSN